jgi:hypothetical protein
MPQSCGVGYQQLQTVVPWTFFSSCKWSFQSEFRRMTIVFTADVKGSMFGRRCCVVFVLTSDITLKNVLQQGDKTLKNYISCPFVSRLHRHLVKYEVSLLYPMNILEICKTSVNCLTHNYNPAELKRILIWDKVVMQCVVQYTYVAR